MMYPAPDGYPEGWWHAAFQDRPNASERRGKPAGNKTMLLVIAYDITSPKRLKKVADCCMDFGMRVQYSVFECRLEADTFERFWDRLTECIDPDEDKLVAYPLHGSQQRKIRTAGNMARHEKVIAYIF
jgi:CRISPR-associated protein Cas2